MAKNWQSLSVIFNNLGRRLDHPLYRALAHDEYPKEYLALAIESALRTGGVPIRGQRAAAFGLGPPERIEGKLDAETAIDIPLDEITFRLVATDFTPAPRRPIRRRRIWKPSKEWVKREIELFGSVLAERKLRAERQFSGLSMIAPSAAGAPRAKKRDHLPPCLEFAKFKRVEVDAEALEKALTPRDACGVEPQSRRLPKVARDLSPKKSLEGPRSRRGAPPKYAWDAIREEAYRLMDHHGDFSDDDPEWNFQAKLEKKLQDFCSGKKPDKEPSSSTLRHRDKIPSWISEWRKLKRAVGN